MKGNKSQAPRLRLRSKRGSGSSAKWYVIDGERLISTGCDQGQLGAAKSKLAKYLLLKAASLKDRLAH